MIRDRSHGHAGSDKICDRSDPIPFDYFVAVAPPTPSHVEVLRLLLSETCHRLNSISVQFNLTSWMRCVKLDLTS
jgi:hypothetical protein